MVSRFLVAGHGLPHAHFMRSLFIFLGFLLAGPACADVYRTTDKDGNTVFTDRPAPGAEKIKTQPINAIKGPPVAPITDSSNRPAVKLTDKYDSFAIVQPAKDEQIRENAGNIAVQIAVQPGLKGGDKVVLTLDGVKVGEGAQTSFNLTDVERGTHTLQAVVKSAQGKELARASSTFSLQRFSVLHPGALQQIQRQATAAQQQQTTGLPAPGQPAQATAPTPGVTGLPAAQAGAPSAGGAALPAAQATAPGAGGPALPAAQADAPGASGPALPATQFGAPPAGGPAVPATQFGAPPAGGSALPPAQVTPPRN